VEVGISVCSVEVGISVFSGGWYLVCC